MKVDKLAYSDLFKVKELLKNNSSIVNPKRIFAELSKSLSLKCTSALKLVVEDAIVGVSVCTDFGEYISLSYYYVSPEYRMTYASLRLYVATLANLDESKPILIETKDITGFERFLTHIKDDLYLFRREG